MEMPTPDAKENWCVGMQGAGGDVNAAKNSTGHKRNAQRGPRDAFSPAAQARSPKVPKLRQTARTSKFFYDNLPRSQSILTSKPRHRPYLTGPTAGIRPRGKHSDRAAMDAVARKAARNRNCPLTHLEWRNRAVRGSRKTTYVPELIWRVRLQRNLDGSN